MCLSMRCGRWTRHGLLQPREMRATPRRWGSSITAAAYSASGPAHADGGLVSTRPALAVGHGALVGRRVARGRAARVALPRALRCIGRAGRRRPWASSAACTRSARNCGSPMRCGGKNRVGAKRFSARGKFERSKMARLGPCGWVSGVWTGHRPAGCWDHAGKGLTSNTSPRARSYLPMRSSTRPSFFATNMNSRPATLRYSASETPKFIPSISRRSIS